MSYGGVMRITPHQFLTLAQAFAAHLPLSFWAFLCGVLFIASYGIWLGGFSEHALVLQKFAAGWSGLSTQGGWTHFGFDSPLIIGVLAALSLVIPMTWATLILSALLWGGVCACVVHLQRSLPLRVGVSYSFLSWLLLLGVALEPFFLRQAVWSPAAAAKIFFGLVVLILVREKRLFAVVGLAMGVLVLCWFEAGLLAFVLAVVLLRREGGLPTCLYVLGLIIPVVGWGLYALHTYGTLIPVGVYTDIALYRHGSWQGLGLRLGQTVGGVFGLNFSGGYLYILSGMVGLCLWLGGYVRWGRHYTVGMAATFGTLAYCLYFLTVRTELSAEAFTLPRLLAVILIAGGALSVLEWCVRKGAPLHVLRYGLLGLWLVCFVATALHAKMWVTYYEGLRAGIGRYIKEHNTKPKTTVLAREVGAIGQTSGLKMLDWRGIADPRIADALQNQNGLQVVRLINAFKPRWVVLRDRDVSNMLATGYDIGRRYDFMQEFEISLDAPKFLRDNPVYIVFKRR